MIKAAYKRKQLIVSFYSFRVLYHDHHDREHASRKTGKEMEQLLRTHI